MKEGRVSIRIQRLPEIQAAPSQSVEAHFQAEARSSLNWRGRPGGRQSIRARRDAEVVGDGLRPQSWREL